MRSLNLFASAKLDVLEEQQLRRTLSETDRGAPDATVRNGRRLISFCCNDYLNFVAAP